VHGEKEAGKDLLDHQAFEVLMVYPGLLVLQEILGKLALQDFRVRLVQKEM